MHSLAARQQGYFTAAQARELGYSYQAQKYQADAGNWTKVDRGIYRLPEWPVGQYEHLVQWTLWSGGCAVVSHATALAAYDLGDLNPSVVHLSVPPGFRRSAPAITVHRTLPPPRYIRESNGFRISAPDRALAEIAADHVDQHQLDIAVADVLDRAISTPRQLRDAAAEIGASAELGIERALAAFRKQ